MRIEWESSWGKPTEESDSREFKNHTFEYLRKQVREHYPVLEKIREREREAEKLAKDYITKEASVSEDEHPFLRPSTLESLHKEICEEQGDNSERAKILRAAMAWSEKRGEIDELKQKAREVLYPPYSKKDPWDYTEEYAARSSLEWTIRDIMVYGDRIRESNDDWDKDYELREELENFLDDIVSERCYIREDFDSFRLYENIGRYLENNKWYFSRITDFLLIDLIDTHLIDLESSFQFGLFPARVADQIGGPGAYFIPSFNSISPGLSPRAKKKRGRWRFRNLMIGLGLIWTCWGNLGGEKIADLLANHGLDLPSWIFTTIGCIGMGLLAFPISSLLYEVINKIRVGYNRLGKAAREFVVIRFEIDSGNYYAKTLIERLKKLEEKGIVIHSLIYALLELRDGQKTYHEV